MIKILLNLELLEEYYILESNVMSFNYPLNEGIRIENGIVEICDKFKITNYFEETIPPAIIFFDKTITLCFTDKSNYVKYTRLLKIRKIYD